MDKKKSQPEGQPLNNLPRHDTSSQAQRARMVAHLLEFGSLTSIAAREGLNCYHPNARIRELRGMGYDILTHWAWAADAFGRRHRVGRWVLVGLPKAANDDGGSHD